MEIVTAVCEKCGAEYTHMDENTIYPRIYCDFCYSQEDNNGYYEAWESDFI